MAHLARDSQFSDLGQCLAMAGYRSEGKNPHIPVMLREILDIAQPQNGGLFIDGTFGVGAYSRALLSAGPCQIIAIDRDPAAIARAKALEAEFGARFAIQQLTFAEMAYAATATLDCADASGQIDAVILDVGVSSPQLDEAERGFSFQQDGPLDMRMAQEGETVAQLIARIDEKELADILYHLGGEKLSRRIAAAIVMARGEAPITTTHQLASIIRRCYPGRGRKHDDIDPATRSFQALRIAINDELAQLQQALEAAEQLLKPDGRLIVVSFHSLEDRIVKNFLRERSGRAAAPSRHLPPSTQQQPAAFRCPQTQALTPQEDEIAFNPRARSAKLRWALRTDYRASHLTDQPGQPASARQQGRHSRKLET